MRSIFLILIFLTIFKGVDGQTIKLWDIGPPTGNNLNEAEANVDHRISKVSIPELSIYLPDTVASRHMAVVICPGGGYSHLASMHEGHQFAEWLTTQGVAGIVLKYRMPNKHKEVPLDDLQQAIRYVRSKSKEWDVDQVGVAGFSAGGHLAATASTHFKSSETRPDFTVLFYPVITMGELTHDGSKTNLLGDNPSSDVVYIYSNEKQVNASTPPAILLLSDDDETVAPQNSVMYYDALKLNGVKASMYIFPNGGHGWGMHQNFEYHNEMLSLLKLWLVSLGKGSNK